MDPNATLAALREAAQGNLDSEALRIIELFEALDDWIKGGGFLPDDWDWSKIAGERFYA